MTTMLPNELNVNNISLSEIKSLDSGAKIMYLNYGSNKAPMYIQAPEMELLFDPLYFEDQNNSGKYTCKLTFKGHESNTNISNFKDKMIEFDQKLIDLAVQNSKKWFGGKSLNLETIENLYTPCVKYNYDQSTGDINESYPPTFSFKVVKRNGDHLCKLFNVNRELINVDDINGNEYTDITTLLKKGSRIQTLLKCNGLWFAGGKFGCTWKGEQIKINHCESLNEYAFRDDGVDDDDDEFIEEEEIITQ
tara:strand:- start:299 stop:1045 length:747 start_codon:yes stop_codon:yes gene_type:complete